jgi:hypothetical protein
VIDDVPMWLQLYREMTERGNPRSQAPSLLTSDAVDETLKLNDDQRCKAIRAPAGSAYFNSDELDNFMQFSTAKIR